MAKRQYTQAIATDSLMTYILLLKRANEPGKGLLSGPGGEVEKGEAPLTCMKREWLEETRIPLRNARIIPLATLDLSNCTNHLYGIVFPRVEMFYQRQFAEGNLQWYHIQGCKIDDIRSTEVAWDGLIPYMLKTLKAKLK